MYSIRPLKVKPISLINNEKSLFKVNERDFVTIICNSFIIQFDFMLILAYIFIIIKYLIVCSKKGLAKTP